ncbi:hypothetical protein YSA_09574 [Pseudomonas putida ND6]|uniref:Uncharacterized protein n=1 Tax=Pseudomonas putida ND6 TaxID=231023 RepID=I3V2J0_PSEPU|nr:hypothetical protein YSA_09574 [Pseudomonas putida ND6]
MAGIIRVFVAQVLFNADCRLDFSKLACVLHRITCLIL